jgi:translation initiation factor 2-alpha kinase 4
MSGSDSGTDSVITSVPASASRVSNDRIDFTVEDLDDISASTSSFPSIHFGHSGSSQTASDDEGSSESVDDFGNLFGSEHKGDLAPSITPPAVARTLYIQMVTQLLRSCHRVEIDTSTRNLSSGRR